MRQSKEVPPIFYFCFYTPWGPTFTILQFVKNRIWAPNVLHAELVMRMWIYIWHGSIGLWLVALLIACCCFPCQMVQMHNQFMDEMWPLGSSKCLKIWLKCWFISLLLWPHSPLGRDKRSRLTSRFSLFSCAHHICWDLICWVANHGSICAFNISETTYLINSRFFLSLKRVDLQLFCFIFIFSNM